MSIFDQWFEMTGFCGYGCGMWGVNHAPNDALCHRRQQERYDQPDAALLYYPDWLAEQMIRKGPLRPEHFLPKTVDGYRPLRTRTRRTPEGGTITELGAVDEGPSARQ